MGRTESIWNELNVIGVTDGIYNDTVAVSKASPYYTPELVAALQDCFINIINTPMKVRRYSPFTATPVMQRLSTPTTTAPALL